MQFPITHIDIFSHNDFNDSLPAGVPLNDLFSLSYNGGMEHPLNQDTLSPGSYNWIQLYPSMIPEDSNAVQTFWVELTKSNGEMVITNDLLIETWE